MNAVQGFIAFLRCEASIAEERSLRLRATAASIEANANSGSGAGRRKRKREQQQAASRPKRAHHTGYSLFVQEYYDSVRKSADAASGGSRMASKDIISLVARKWSEIGDLEKQAWQYRAEQLRQAQEGDVTHPPPIDGSARQQQQDVASIEAMGLEPPAVGDADDWGNRKRPAARKPSDKIEPDQGFEPAVGV